MKLFTYLFFLFFSVTQTEAQTIKSLTDSFPVLRKDFIKPANWKEADKNRSFYYAKYPSSMNLDTALKIITTEKDFDKFAQAKKWCVDHYVLAIPHLLDLLIDTTKIGLENTADLIIWDRINTKELNYYGHGGIIFEDIFTIAGRCSYILHELTGENFMLVHISTTKETLSAYQEIWLNWFWQL